MNKLTKDLYEQQSAKCEGLCQIDHDRISLDNPNLMPCVTCPFCLEIVDAILSPDTITCPKCGVEVKKG